MVKFIPVNRINRATIKFNAMHNIAAACKNADTWTNGINTLNENAEIKEI
jgi:hypothetical protein